VPGYAQHVEMRMNFLVSLTSHQGFGDAKFVPDLDPESLEAISVRTDELRSLFAEIEGPIFSLPPFGLGYPGKKTQSAYYPDSDDITAEEIAAVGKVLATHSIRPENTRVRKSTSDGTTIYEVLQASSEIRTTSSSFPMPEGQGIVQFHNGDHSAELNKICEHLERAVPYAADDLQRQILKEYIESFHTGDREVYRQSQRSWVKDKLPQVETAMGFIETYRDPSGNRAQFEAIVGIADAEETKGFTKLVDSANDLIKLLPWVPQGGFDNGAFEKALFDAPSLSSIHSKSFNSFHEA
jgi:dipeptidyl-peptidase III